MATLTAVKFPKATGADEALAILERLQREEAITIHDGAIVSGTRPVVMGELDRVEVNHRMSGW